MKIWLEKYAKLEDIFGRNFKYSTKFAVVNMTKLGNTDYARYYPTSWNVMTSQEGATSGAYFKIKTNTCVRKKSKNNQDDICSFVTCEIESWFWI